MRGSKCPNAGLCVSPIGNRDRTEMAIQPRRNAYLTLPWDIRGSEVSGMLVRMSEAILAGSWRGRPRVSERARVGAGLQRSPRLRR